MVIGNRQHEPECVYYDYCGNEPPEQKRKRADSHGWNLDCEECLDALRDGWRAGEWPSKTAFIADYYGKEYDPSSDVLLAEPDERAKVLYEVSQSFRYVLWCESCGDVQSYKRNSKTVRAGREGRLTCDCGGLYELIRSNPPDYVTIE
jgi:hypothetical protein